jgi:hypothetical protein
MDVDDFCQRQGREATEMMRQHSKAYLIEELAIFTLEARTLSSLKLYPGNEPNCVHVVRNGLVPEAPQGLDREQYAKVKFHTRGQHELAPDVTPGPALPESSHRMALGQLALP